MDATHDLFLSYRWADKPAVEPLLAALQVRGVRVWQDAREVEDLASIQQAVANGLAKARALLAWYSVKYNASRACQWELTSAYTAAQAEGDPRRRILVVNPEKGNAHVHLPELFDQLHLSGAEVPGDAVAVQALADRIQTALERVPTTELGALRSLTAPLWFPAMGTGSNRFVGRLREMWQLHGALQAGQAAMLTATGGKAGLALVRGAGGIGKSLMAEEYALRFGAAYPGGVFWLRAFGHPDGGRELDATQRSTERDAQELDIALRLGIDTANLNPAQVRGALARHFAQQAQPYLWVVDDLPSDPGSEGLGGWQAPHPLGCTLFTTRTRRFNAVTAIELPQLEADDARRLLTRARTLSTTDVQIADEICELLGYHALAVDVTAALGDRRGLGAVREALQHPSRDALALAAEFEEALPNGHQRQIAATFLASIEQLDEPAREILRIAAVLAVAPIPSRLLRKAVVAAGGTDEGDAQDRVDLAIDQLLSASLADDAGDHSINVHTLVSRTVWFTESSPEPWAALRVRLIDVLAAEMILAADVREHAALAPWVTHARELSGAPEDTATAGLLGWVARFDYERASYALAKQGLERQLEVIKRVLGEEHPDTLTSMSNLAEALGSQGDLPYARRLLEAVLGARKRVLGEEHPDTLTSMNDLAETLGAQGDQLGARRLHEVVLEARRRMLGEEHPDTLISISNLALTLWTGGDLPGARRLQEAVLEASRRVMGEEHLDTLISMNNLAQTLSDQGDLPGARQLQEAVLEARRRVLGEEHPATLTAMGNLAALLWDEGDQPGARRLQEAVLEASRRVLGEEHPDTLTSINNLAETLRAQGDLPGARRLHEAVLEASKRVRGKEHPDTLTSMSNLALTLWAEGDLSSARPLEEAVLEARRRVLGEEHPDTLTSMSNLAETLGAQGDLPSARRLHEAVLEASKRVRGKEHPDTLTSMNNLAETLRAEGNLPGARLLEEAVLEARRRVLGEEHPETLISISNLALTLGAEGDVPGARRLQEAVLEASKRVLGEDHPATLTSMSNLAETLEAQGDQPNARRLQDAVLEARRRVLGEEHPDTLTSMSNLAASLGAEGDVPGARRLQEAVLEASKRVLGEEHPATLTSMSNLAASLRAEGNLPGARRLQEAVMEVSKRVLGEEHPITLILMSNLAYTLWDQGDLPGARRLQEAVLEVRRRVLGEEHPDTLTSLSNLAETLGDQGDYLAAMGDCDSAPAAASDGSRAPKNPSPLRQ